VQKARQDGDRRNARDDDDRKPKRPPLGTSRTANVWMAPGARPVAQKKAKDETAAAEPKRRILRLKKDTTSEQAPAGELKPKRPQRTARPEQSERGKRPERKERPAKREATKPEGNRPARTRSAGATRSADGEGGRFRGKPSSEGKPDRGRTPAEGRPERSRPPRAGKPEGGKPPRARPALPRPENTGSDQGSGNDGKDGGADRRR
jgi:23S rRNA pseudouridine2605 synthase